MKKPVAFFLAALMLVIGLVSGFVIRDTLHIGIPAPRLSPSSADSSAPRPEDSGSTLLMTAAFTLNALQQQDYKALAALTDPEQGLTFTPLSTVDTQTDLTFTAKQLKGAASDSTAYIWGVSPETNEPIRMTIPAYFQTYVWDADYAAPQEIGLNQVLYAGNAEENVVSAYPDCQFLDFYVPGTADDAQGWSALKLVFTWSHDRWKLVGIVHSKWMP